MVSNAMRSLFLLCGLVACTSPGAHPDARVEISTEPVMCGAGIGGEIVGTLRTLDGTVVDLSQPTPQWSPYATPGGSDGAPGLVLASDPRIVIYNVGSVNRMLPTVGEYSVSVNASTVSGGARVIIDESDRSTTPGCLAGRFEADFNSGGSGRIVGWFRTR